MIYFILFIDKDGNSQTYRADGIHNRDQFLIKLDYLKLQVVMVMTNIFKNHTARLYEGMRIYFSLRKKKYKVKMLGHYIKKVIKMESLTLQ